MRTTIDTSKHAATIERVRKLVRAMCLADRDGLHLYEPLPKARKFHASKVTRRLALGSNQSGKTKMTIWEFAAALRGEHPNYPKPPLLAIAVALDEESIGTVMWKGLTETPFPIIKDRKTGKWRCVQPRDKDDLRRKKEWQQGEPFLPARMISKITWKHKGKKIPHIVYLLNGSEIRFYSGEADPPHGVQVDIAWIDEEVPDRWYAELMMRLLAKQGRFIWSATQQIGYDQLFELEMEADMPLSDGQVRTIEKYRLLIEENVFLTEQSLAQAKASVQHDPEQYRVRIEGQPAIIGFTIYPEFRPKDIHAVEPGPIPWDWTRYIAIDFGRDPCAVLFSAVPPVIDKDGKPHRYEIHFYDELYIRSCTAGLLARTLKNKLNGSWVYGIIVDHRSGRTRDLSRGLPLESQVMDAFEKEGVKSIRGGFIWGCMDWAARVESMHTALAYQADGKPTVFVHKDRLPTLCWEMRKYRRKKNQWGQPDAKAVDKDDHLIWCAECTVHYKPQWEMPPPPGHQTYIDPVDRMQQTLRAYQAMVKPERQMAACYGPPSYNRAEGAVSTWP